ncbi:MAG: M20/M25/M40 family metallo-hydrolase [Deltaproteobacteria bacterium]|nr:M20/M25/M40 family metallo-hydrolase [Deltaproteobacteria bacterium]
MDVVSLTKRLMNIPSVSGAEGELARMLYHFFRQQRYSVQRIPTAKNRWNLFATFGKPKIVLCSHLDTVPPVLAIREDRNALYGRGACDAKGVIAAQMAAGIHQQDVGFLYVVGEEVDHQGAIDVAKVVPKLHALIVGEPTENKLAIGTKGIVKVVLSVRGRAAHSAYPERGVSAVHVLVETISKILALPLGKHRRWGVGNLNVGKITGGIAANVLAPHATCEILVRTVGPSAAMYQKIKKICLPPIRVELVAMNDPIALDSVSGFETTVVAFNTDLPYLKRKAKKWYLLGPGSILDAHTAYEKISKKELYKAVELYRMLIDRIRSKNF